ncbi:transglutaminaseTgpA domain-containing protein [Streptacidiphilus monticola]
MSGRTRIAWCGAAATVLTSLCLFPLVSPSSWLVEAAFFVFLLAGVGLLARRLSLPRPVTVLVQLLVAVLLVTLAFAAGAAWAAVVPSPPRCGSSQSCSARARATPPATPPRPRTPLG